MCKRPQTLAKISSSSVLCYILCLNIRIFYVFYPCQHVQRVLPQPARYMYIVPHCTGTFFFTGKFTGIPWCGKILQFTALISTMINITRMAHSLFSKIFLENFIQTVCGWLHIRRSWNAKRAWNFGA